MSHVELAVEKVKRLDENQAEALLESLELREKREALRERLDREIETGLAQLRRGEGIPGARVHAELRERSRERRSLSTVPMPNRSRSFASSAATVVSPRC
jgi:hypothetical protein